MNRNIRKVRQGIKERKKLRENNERATLEQSYPILASDEEKHGFNSSLPYYFEDTTKSNRLKQVLPNQLMYKWVGAIGLFFICLFIFQTNIAPLQNTKDWLMTQLNEEFPFATVNEWYVANFGVPLSITPQKVQFDILENGYTLPVIGHVTEVFSDNGTGIMISPENETVVSAMRRGVVIFAGNDPETMKTVIIQHGDNSKSTYGFLSSIHVHTYQIVESEEVIGTFQPSEQQSETVFFSIEKGNQYIDPFQVIPVDDLP